MLGSELAYVREKLKKLPPAERKRVSDFVGIHVKTLNRLASKETKYGRTDTVGKLAVYFRSMDSRSQ